MGVGRGNRVADVETETATDGSKYAADFARRRADKTHWRFINRQKRLVLEENTAVVLSLELVDKFLNCSFWRNFCVMRISAAMHNDVLGIKLISKMTNFVKGLGV